MRTRLKILGSLPVFLGFTLFSCTSETVETEMKRWCDCEQQAKGDASMNAQCAEMMKDIVRKYEFDPEAVVKIRTGILECNNK